MSATLLGLVAILTAEPDPPQDAKAALRPLDALVGSWKCVGKTDEKSKSFWTEKAGWSWKFAKDAVSLDVNFTDGQHYTRGELKYRTDPRLYELTLHTTAKTVETYTGKLTLGQQKEPILELERTVDEEIQRITLTILHSNRYLMSHEVKAARGTSFRRKYQIGATKEGEPFVNLIQPIACVVTGGKGTMAVMYMGKVYFVCCSGCRDAFLEDPSKYVGK